MSIRNFDKLFRPHRVALIGATERPGSVGAVVARNLRRAGFAGELLLVNPHLTNLDGMTVYRDVASLPHPPDLAVIVTPPDTVPGLVAELGARGTRAAVVITAGFGELGERGPRVQQAMLDAARPHLLRADRSELRRDDRAPVSGSTRASRISRRRPAISPLSASRAR